MGLVEDFGVFFSAAQALNEKVEDYGESEHNSALTSQSCRSRFKSLIRRVLYIVKWELHDEEHRKKISLKANVSLSEMGTVQVPAGRTEKPTNRMVKLALTVQPGRRNPQMLARIKPYIARLKCCETLDPTVRSQLPAIVEYECLDKGRYIVKQGHAGESYYMIVSGTVDVMIEGEGGLAKYVNILKSGQGFGEVALVNKGPRTASICTREPTELLRIDRDQFHEVLRASKLQEMAKKTKFLRNHPALQGLPEDVLKKFVDNAIIKSYKPAEMIVRVGEETVDHVIIVMSGECFVETKVMLDYYKLNDGRFLLDLPTNSRPDIHRLKRQATSESSRTVSTASPSTASPSTASPSTASPSTASPSTASPSSASDYTSPISDCCYSTRSSHPRARLQEEPSSAYKDLFSNDVKSVNVRQYHLCLRRIPAQGYFSVSDLITTNRCNVGPVKKCEVLLLPKILFQKYNVSRILETMAVTERLSTLTVEEAFAAFLKRRHWELYKKKLVSDVLKNKTKH